MSKIELLSLGLLVLGRVGSHSPLFMLGKVLTNLQISDKLEIDNVRIWLGQHGTVFSTEGDLFTDVYVHNIEVIHMDWCAFQVLNCWLN